MEVMAPIRRVARIVAAVGRRYASWWLTLTAAAVFVSRWLLIPGTSWSVPLLSVVFLVSGLCALTLSVRKLSIWLHSYNRQEWPLAAQTAFDLFCCLEVMIAVVVGLLLLAVGTLFIGLIAWGAGQNYIDENLP